MFARLVWFDCLESVCIGTAPGMAVEPDSGVAVSVTGGALECWLLNRACSLADLMTSALVDGFLFASLRPWCSSFLHLFPSAATCSQLLGSSSSAFMSRLHASLKRRWGRPAHGCRRQARRRADLLGSSHQACGKRVRASGDGATEAVCKDWRVQCGRAPHCLSPCLTTWFPGCAACSAYGIMIYMAKLSDSDWMTATQVF